MNLTNNKCIKCDKPLTGRADKKFCDSYCRNSFNNQSRSSEEVLITAVNKVLRKNRRILRTLSPLGKAIVRKEVAAEMGFNFSHFSAIFSSKQGVYYLCYDYGYRAVMDNGKQKIQIIQQQEYMKSFNPWKYLK